MERIVLQAEEGKILTDGCVYGKVIFLADGIDPNSFYEITEEEYNAQLEEIAAMEDNKWQK